MQALLLSTYSTPYIHTKGLPARCSLVYIPLHPHTQARPNTSGVKTKPRQNRKKEERLQKAAAAATADPTEIPVVEQQATEWLWALFL